MRLIYLGPTDTYSNIPNKPDSPDALFEGTNYVKWVEICEPSTQDILAMVTFKPDNVACMTATNTNDNSKYWVVRNFDENGETTQIKVGSNAANEWYLNVTIYKAKDESPYMTGYIPKPDNGVVSPEGEVLSDPYSDPELKIAGFKELKFKCSHGDGKEIRDAMEKAGYKPGEPQYGDGIYSFKTEANLIGRAKMERQC